MGGLGGARDSAEPGTGFTCELTWKRFDGTDRRNKTHACLVSAAQYGPLPDYSAHARMDVRACVSSPKWARLVEAAALMQQHANRHDSMQTGTASQAEQEERSTMIMAAGRKSGAVIK